MYIDLHNHILPGLDDGARDMKQSHEMLKIAYENHISVIVATPHNKANRHNPGKDTIEKYVAQLQEYADEQGYGIRLYSGTELL